MNNRLGSRSKATPLSINIEVLANVRREGSHPCQAERIITPAGDAIGKFVWALVFNEEQLNDFINFRDGSFPGWRDKIPLREIWPMAVLHDLEIPDERNRGKGFGKRAVGTFLKRAKASKANCAFLRVGNGKEEDQLNKSLHIYKSHGFILLDRKEHDSHLMYCDLATSSFGTEALR